MFHVGDLVVYENNGVCKVENIAPLDTMGVKRDRLYYTLIPVYEKGGKLFTPVDNQKMIIRKVINSDEAKKILDEIEDMETDWIMDDRQREYAFKEEMKTCDCRKWAKIIKSLYVHKQNRLAAGKKVTNNDKKYLKLAEDNLYGELAIALKKDKEEVEQDIRARFKESNRNV